MYICWSPTVSSDLWLSSSYFSFWSTLIGSKFEKLIFLDFLLANGSSIWASFDSSTSGMSARFSWRAEIICFSSSIFTGEEWLGLFDRYAWFNFACLYFREGDESIFSDEFSADSESSTSFQSRFFYSLITCSLTFLDSEICYKGIAAFITEVENPPALFLWTALKASSSL